MALPPLSGVPAPTPLDTPNNSPPLPSLQGTTSSTSASSPNSATQPFVSRLRRDVTASRTDSHTFSSDTDDDEGIVEVDSEDETSHRDTAERVLDGDHGGGGTKAQGDTHTLMATQPQTQPPTSSPTMYAPPAVAVNGATVNGATTKPTTPSPLRFRASSRKIRLSLSSVQMEGSNIGDSSKSLTGSPMSLGGLSNTVTPDATAPNASTNAATTATSVLSSVAEPPLALTPPIIDLNLFTPSLATRILKVGRYVGKGTSATCYRAVDVVTLRMYALKVIRIDEEVKARMLGEELMAMGGEGNVRDVDEEYEVDTVSPRSHESHLSPSHERKLNAEKSSLAHPDPAPPVPANTAIPYTNRIVDYYGSWYDAPTATAYMLMEYMGTGTLESVVKNVHPKNRPSEGSEGPEIETRVFRSIVQRLARDIFRGIRDFHEMNRVHRDIKPANVLINTSGTAKISDFGLAKSVEAAIDAKATSFVGTFNFMSPERLEGKKYTQRSDIWSAGMTLYYAIMGEYPLDASQGFWELLSELDQLKSRNLIEDDPVATDFLVKCFAKEENRASAKELLEHEYFKEEPDCHKFAQDWGKIGLLLAKNKRDQKQVSSLTSHDTNEAAMVVVKRREERRLSNPPAKHMIRSLARNLEVFPVTVEDSFKRAVENWQSELSSYELSEKEGLDVSANTRSRRRRRTFVARSLTLSTPKAGTPFTEEEEYKKVTFGEMETMHSGEGGPREGASTRMDRVRSEPEPRLSEDEVDDVIKTIEGLELEVDSMLEGTELVGNEKDDLERSERGCRRRRRRTYDGGLQKALNQPREEPKERVLPVLAKAKTLDEIYKEEEDGKARTLRTSSMYNAKPAPALPDAGGGKQEELTE